MIFLPIDLNLLKILICYANSTNDITRSTQKIIFAISIVALWKEFDEC